MCSPLLVPDFLYTSSQITDALYSSHYNDVIMRTLAFQLTGVSICGSTVVRRRSKKTSKLRVTGLCAGNSPVTSVFPALKASNGEIFQFDDVIIMGGGHCDSKAVISLIIEWKHIDLRTISRSRKHWTTFAPNPIPEVLLDVFSCSMCDSIKYRRCDLNHPGNGCDCLWFFSFGLSPYSKYFMSRGYLTHIELNIP